VKIFTVNKKLKKKQSKLLPRYHARGHCDPFLHSNTLARGRTLDEDRQPCHQIIFFCDSWIWFLSFLWIWQMIRLV